MTLRAGIVGCGGISGSHAGAHANLEGVDLVAMCDINRDGAQQPCRRIRCLKSIHRLRGDVRA